MKNKKIFGIFNILDIVIIAILLIIAVFAVLKIKSNKEVAGVGEVTRPTYIEFYDDDVQGFVKGHIAIGSTVKDATQSIDLGQVISVEYGPSEDFHGDNNGKSIKSAKEGYCSVRVKAKTNGKITDNGMTINSYTYYVGKSMEVRAGQVAIYPRVSDMGELTDEEIKEFEDYLASKNSKVESEEVTVE